MATTASTARAAARCTPGTVSGAPPLNFRLGGGRVGGAVMDWWTEPGAEYLVERSPDGGGGRRIWTRLTSTCDFPSGMNHTQIQWEDGNSYPVISLVDIYPGLQLEYPYIYRVTVIRPDGATGSIEAPHTPPGGRFFSDPIAAVNGNTVRVAADVSYCTKTDPPLPCNPWMLEVVVTNSSTGFSYSRREAWANSYEPSLPPTIPGGVDGAFVFTVSGVPTGTHTFMVTALYQPDHRVVAGSVTVTVP